MFHDLSDVVASSSLEDLSQIVRFVSIFIADGFEGISRIGTLTGVDLHAYAVTG